MAPNRMATNGASGNWCQTTPGNPGHCGPHGTTAGVHSTIRPRKNRCADKGLRSATTRMVPELHLALRGSHQPAYDHVRSSAITSTDGEKARQGRSRAAGRRREREAHRKRTLATHFSPHFSSDFRVASGTKSSPFGTEISSLAVSFVVGESEKKSRCPEAI